MGTLNRCRLRIDLLLQYLGSPDLGESQYALRADDLEDVELQHGTGDGQSNLVYSDTATLAAAGTSTYDLRGGGLQDPVGGTLDMAKVKMMMLLADPTNTGDLEVGGASAPFVANISGDATPATGSIITLKPGDVHIVACPVGGWTIGAGSNDQIKVTNISAASQSFKILLVGVAGS